MSLNPKSFPVFFIIYLLWVVFHHSLAQPSDPTDIDGWCDTTPHPEPCKFFMDHGHIQNAPTLRSEFRKMMVKATLARAINARHQLLQYRPSSDNKRRMFAWYDCLKLYDNTIIQLNRSMDGLEYQVTNRTRCSDFDLQTWLSTSLTNLETCRMGPQDLNVLNFTLPESTANLSQLISNSLAVNDKLLESEKPTSYFNEGEFPPWLTNHARKLLQTSSIKANLVVAKDGSGHFRTVQAALNAAAKRKYMTRFVIYVKRGVYTENIEVAINNNYIMLIGDGLRYTIITGSRSVSRGYTTYSTATAGIDGLGFIARGITFRNTAGPLRGQAVALRSASDLSVFYRCGIEGYQDTLFVHSQRQFYRECYIYGTIDFIFGNAAVVFQNCVILVRRPLNGQANMITAQGRNDPYQNTGITIQNSRVIAASDLQPVARAFKTYLGRPWQQYSRTVYIKTYLDSLISPFGWSTWGNTNFALDTLYYGEYKNFGPGSSTRYRVKWKGYHLITSATEASKFTVTNLIAGQSWLRVTGVPFASGL